MRRTILKREVRPEEGPEEGALGGFIEIAGRKIEMRRARGGLVATAGFLLSPVSWWNDLFVNIPIAYAFGALAGLVSEELFLPAMVLGYWITNVLGLFLMHRGLEDLLSKDGRSGRRWRRILTDLSVSAAYTIVVVLLVEAGVLRLPGEYFP